MFFSSDLLGKKSPLGVIWLISHGKKVSRHKIMQCKVDALCKELLEPEVPHALRLQGILCAGVTRVFSKQQTYLLHDCQEMVKRVMQSMMPDQDQQTMLPVRKQVVSQETITLDLVYTPYEEDFDIKAFQMGDNGRLTQRRSSDEDDLFYLEVGIETGGVPGLNTRMLQADAQQPELQGLPLMSRHGSDDWGALGTPGQGPRLTHQLSHDDGEQALMPTGNTPFALMEPEMFQGAVQLEGHSELSDEEFSEALQLTQPQQEVLEEELSQSHAKQPEDQATMQQEELDQPSLGQHQDREVAQFTKLPAACCNKRPAKAAGRQAKRQKPQVDDMMDTMINTHQYRAWQLDASDLVAYKSWMQLRNLAIQAAHHRMPLQSLNPLTGLPSLPEIIRNSTILSSMYSNYETQGAPNTGILDRAHSTALAANDISSPQNIPPLTAMPSPSDNIGHAHNGPQADMFDKQHTSLVQNCSPRLVGSTLEDDEHMDRLTQLPTGQPSLLPSASFLGRASGGAAATPSIGSDLEIEAMRGKGASITPGTLPPDSKDGSHHLGLTPGFNSADMDTITLPRGHTSVHKQSTSNISEQQVPKHLAIDSPAPHLARVLGRRRMSSNVSSGIELGDSARNQDVWPTDDISDFQLKASTPQNDDEHPVLAGHSATITAAETALSDMTQDTLDCIQDFKDEFDKTETDMLSFFEITSGLSRHHAAMVFFQLQVMISHGFITVHQEDPYGDMMVLKGSKLD